MKTIMIVFISCIWLSANDVQRVDDIMHDIQNLKASASIPKDNQNNNEMLQQQIAMLEETIKEQSVELENSSKALAKTIVVRKIKENNPTPVFKMKPKYFKIATFRVSRDADIYDSQNGAIIDKWAKGTSFTSSERTDDMIQITGYFVDKIWRGSKKDMWIKSINAFER
jgi:hypothetical protein